MFRTGKRGKRDLDDLGLEFPFSHSVKFYEYILYSAAPSVSTLILDFFAGSGTTAHAVINLNREDGGRRKYILVEMADYFHTVILPRVKKVVFSDHWKDGKAQPGQGISHFAKYYELEQYEDALRRAHYDDAPLLAAVDPYGPYAFLRDLKLMKDTVALDIEADKVNIRLDELYPGIDLAETLSCVTGKPIKRITREAVEFRGGTTASLTDPDWNLLKPLLWW
jgi:adenine-specific DNA-methyltransferase